MLLAEVVIMPALMMPKRLSEVVEISRFFVVVTELKAL